MKDLGRSSDAAAFLVRGHFQLGAGGSGWSGRLKEVRSRAEALFLFHFLGEFCHQPGFKFGKHVVHDAGQAGVGRCCRRGIT
jgi:hypothetical protein